LKSSSFSLLLLNFFKIPERIRAQTVVVRRRRRRRRRSGVMARSGGGC